MSYFKCSKCGKEKFFISNYEILGNWVGKISSDKDSRSDLTPQPDLCGYMATSAVCTNCSHIINVFNEDLNGLIEHLQKISIVEK